jgi:hypothetical protein
MIQLNIVKTAKGFSNKDKFRIYDTTKEKFKDIKQAKQWLNEEYKCKRQPMYASIDGKDYKIGYVFGFVNKYDSPKSIEQHWVSFEEVKPVIL